MVTEKITLNNPERFQKTCDIPREKLIKAAERATDKLAAFAKKNPCSFPGTRSIDYKYVCAENENWEAGMYTGCYWLAYEITGDPFFRKEAESHFGGYKRRLVERKTLLGHDVGFPYMPSIVAQYKITGEVEARQLALDVASHFLNNSYNTKGQYRYFHTTSYRTMMDTLMNATLLLWAGAESGDDKFTVAGLHQSVTTNALLIRGDGSSYHHCMFDPETGMPIKCYTWQGNRDESCWSRGHAWGVYGLPIAYSYTKADFLPELHKALTYFMLNRLPEDMIPYWDYDFTSGDEPRDASAGLISACGMLEMAKLLPDTSEDKAIFESASARMVEAVIDRCTTDIGRDYDGLIHHVTHAKPQGQGINECAVYGDYFYLEALCRYLKGDSFTRYW